MGVDWYLDHPDQLGELRHELVAYLTRHAVADSGGDIEDSELVVSEAVGNAMRHTSGPVWVSLAWASEHPTLTVYDVGPGFDPAEVRVAGSEPGLPVAAAAGAHDSDIDPHELIEDSGRGLLIMSALAPRLSASLRDAAGTVLTLTLPARRAPSASFDPPRRHAGVLPSMAEADPEVASARRRSSGRWSSSSPRRSRRATDPRPPRRPSRRSGPMSVARWRRSSASPPRRSAG